VIIEIEGVLLEAAATDQEFGGVVGEKNGIAVPYVDQVDYQLA
jgi:hypothetical protein